VTQVLDLKLKVQTPVLSELPVRNAYRRALPVLDKLSS
jgi:hypothetical protein